MSFSDFLEKIQRKPRYIRLQILWLAVFISMFFIISLWLTSLKYSMSSISQETERPEEISQPLEEIKKEIPSLKETLKAAISVFFERDSEEKIEESANQTELEEQKENINQLEKEPEEVKPAKLPLSP